MYKNCKFRPKNAKELIQILEEGVECKQIDFSELETLKYLFGYDNYLVNKPNVYFGSYDEGNIVWNTENVKDMSYMFYCCNRFDKPVRFIMSKLENIEYMFYGCSSFNQALCLDFINVRNAVGVFQNCKKLNKSIEIKNLGAKKIDISYMFDGCDSLEEIKLLNIEIINEENVNGKYVYQGMDAKEFCFFLKNKNEKDKFDVNDLLKDLDDLMF